MKLAVFNPHLMLHCQTYRYRQSGLVLFWLFLCLSPSVFAQVNRPEARFEQPSTQTGDFTIDAAAFKDEKDDAKVEIYSRIPYPKLTFVKQDSLFVARYELTVHILDKSERLAKELVQVDTCRATTYAKTNDNNIFHTDDFIFTLAPGIYQVRATIRDLESNRQYEARQPLIIKSYLLTGARLSSVILVQTKFDTATGNIEYTRNMMAAIIQNVTSPQLYYEVYVKGRDMDSLILQYDIMLLSAKNSQVDSYFRRFPTTGAKTRVLDTLSMAKLLSGNYLLTISLIDKLSGDPIDKSSLVFYTRVQGQSLFIRNLDEAINQLIYIADDDIVDKMRESKSQEEKMKLFNAFWKKVDPTPNSPENELMLQYYSRIEFANQHYTTFMSGWKTDMGRIFIKFGPPDFVDRQPFSADSNPYEIWEYYQHNLRLIFVDQSGFGNYRLLRPEWDSRNRIR
jgi:GWxTD domain-containing protein